MLHHMRGFRLQSYQCRILYAFLTRMAVLVMFLLEAHVTMATVPHLILEFDFLPEANVTMATVSTVALALGGILTVVLALEEILLLLLRKLDAMWHKSQLNMAIPPSSQAGTNYSDLLTSWPSMSQGAVPSYILDDPDFRQIGARGLGASQEGATKVKPSPSDQRFKLSNLDWGNSKSSSDDDERFKLSGIFTK